MEESVGSKRRKAVRLGVIIGLCVFFWYLGAMFLVLQS